MVRHGNSNSRNIRHRLLPPPPSSRVYLGGHVFLFVVGVLLTLLHHPVLVGIGAALIATGIAGWTLYLWILVSEDRTRRMELVDKLGFIDAFPTRANTIRSEYDPRLNNARESIDILGFGLSHLLQDYRDDFEGWASRARVRILLIDVDASSAYGDQRDIEEGNSPGTIRDDVRVFIEQTKDLRSRFPEKFCVRTYTALPSINVFRIDNEIFWGPYLLTTQSRNTPTLLIGRRSFVFDAIERHFDQLWSSEVFSKSVDQPEAS